MNASSVIINYGSITNNNNEEATKKSPSRGYDKFALKTEQIGPRKLTPKIQFESN